MQKSPLKKHGSKYVKLFYGGGGGGFVTSLQSSQDGPRSLTILDPWTHLPYMLKNKLGQIISKFTLDFHILSFIV